MTETAAVPAPSPRQMKRIVAASLTGNALEWYDFFLYTTAAALVLNTVFFPAGVDPLLGTLAAFAGHAVGFAARPLGGLIFGHVGDRVGRKTALIITLSMMGGATFCMGLLPTYAAIGVTAPVLLVVLRIIQGVAAGGEWGGGVLLISENAPDHRRGFFSSFSQTGVSAGFVISSLVLLLAQQVSGEGFQSWGWRIPFLASVVIFGLGIYIRMRLRETSAFQQAHHEGERVSMPLKEVLRNQPREVLVAMGLRVAENGGSYIFLAFSLAYGEHIGIPSNILLWGVLISMTVDCVTMVLFGRLSDHVGRRPVYLLGSAGLVAFAIPFFLLINTQLTALVWLAMIIGNGLCHAAMIGTQPAFFSELFTTDVRYSGLALGHEIAAVFAGGLSPLIATALLATYNSFLPVALFLMGLAAITVITLVFARETRPTQVARPVP